MKHISPLGEIQQTGASERAAKSVAPCFAFGYWLQALGDTFVFHYQKLPQEASLRWRSAMTWVLQHLHCTQLLSNHGQLVSILLGSGSTKAGVGQVPLGVTLICTEVFLWLTHQKFY